MQKIKSVVPVYMKRAGTVLALAGTSVAANAADYTTQISGAATEANANQTAVITAVIALAVLSFGVGALLAWMRK